MNRLYTIKEVSVRTSLSTQLIRKWEERYGAVTPSRFPNGYRGYTKQDIDKLLWLKNRVDDGVPIGLAVQDMKQHGTLPPAAGRSPARRGDDFDPDKLDAKFKEYGNKLISYFLKLDQAGAQRYCDQMLAMHNMDFVLTHVLHPVHIELALSRERGDIFEYQEHFGSEFIRERLVAAKAMYAAVADKPLLITACSPHEWQELGVLFFGYFALQQGFQNVYLGAAPAVKGLIDCIEQVRPAAFVFGSSSERQLREAFGFYRELDKRIEEHRMKTKVFICGRAISEDAVLPGAKSIYIMAGTAQETVQKIKKLIAR